MLHRLYNFGSYLIFYIVTMNSLAKQQVLATNPSDAALLDTRIVFSDVDGTLVHYPEESIPENNDEIIALPPSSTGMKAIISHDTLRKCRAIRQKGQKLVLVSGMRTSTLLNRLPYLPRADAYCSEAGGRIFYPTNLDDGVTSDDVRIEPLSFDGATAEDLKAFGLQEDLEWRKIMEKAAGADGFVGQELGMLLSASSLSSSQTPALIPVSQRQGQLWEYARLLQEHGLTLDTKGYATSFRVTARQQKESSMDTFLSLQRQEALPCPPQVTTRTNLGSMDFFPTICGKKNV